jgi:hypothetical protein
MNPMYPKALSWQAKRAGIPLDTAKTLWIEAVRDATDECDVVESPEYWKSAVDHLHRRIANEVRARRSAPLGWGSYIRLPATQWFHGLATAGALLTIGVRTACTVQQRPCF